MCIILWCNKNDTFIQNLRRLMREETRNRQFDRSEDEMCFQLPSRTRRIVVTVRETESNPDFGSPLCWANRLVCWPSTGYLHVASGPVKAAAWQGDEIMGRAQTRSCAPENWFPTPWKNGHRGGWPREGGRGERLEHAVGSQPSRSWAGQSSKSTLPTILIMT